MKLNTIKSVGRSDFVNMGPIRLRQPLPAQQIEMVDPFILLHHYGPYEINEKSNPFDLGPPNYRRVKIISKWFISLDNRIILTVVCYVFTSYIHVPTFEIFSYLRV